MQSYFLRNPEQKGRCVLAKLINKYLEGKCYTQSDLKNIADLFKYNGCQINKEQEDNERRTAQEILKQDENYNEMLDRLKKKQEQKRLTKGQIVRIKSRILYGLGNKKYQEIKTLVEKVRAYPQFEKNLSKLSAKQIDELVKYDFIENQIEAITNSFDLKYREIKSISQNMSNLLKFFNQRKQQIQQISKDFNLKHGIKVGTLSRQACEKDTRAIFILIKFMKESIQNLYKEGVPINQIQKRLQLLIQYLQRKFPPGEDPAKGDKRQSRKLRRMIENDEVEVQWDKEKDPLTNNPKIILSGDNKQQKLEEQIKEKAKIAKEQLQNLRSIIRQTCLKKCIGVESNVKLDLQWKEGVIKQKLTRITEKMLLKKPKETLEQQYLKQHAFLVQGQGEIRSQIQSKDQQQEPSLQNYVEKQQEDYKQKVNNILQGKTEIEFTISDMVRGKCTYSKIEDIIEVVKKIKNFVSRSDGKYRILEVESRFTNPIPISDITLKIALKERIIGELQLTIQQNVAQYKFAHKIYELQRSKAFSKIATLFKFHEEVQGEFKELLANQINQMKLSRNQEYRETQQILKQYFKLSIDQSEIPKLNNDVSLALASNEQKIVVQAVFERVMQISDQQRALLIKQHYRKMNNELFNSVLWHQSMKGINAVQMLSAHLDRNTFYNYLTKDWFNGPSKEHLNHIQVIIKFYQLSLLVDLSKKQFDAYFENKLYPKSSLQRIKHHKSQDRQKLENRASAYEELLKILYGQGVELLDWNKKKGLILEHGPHSQDAYNSYRTAERIAQQIYNDQEKQNNEQISEIQRHQARVLIWKKKFLQAQNLLQALIETYKQKKSYKNAIICLLMLSECSLCKKEYQKFQQFVDQANKMKEMHKVSYDGFQIIRCQYRISNNLSNHMEGLSDETIIEQWFYHTRLVFQDAKHLTNVELYQLIKLYQKFVLKLEKAKRPTTLVIKKETLRPYLVKLGRFNIKEAEQWSQLKTLELGFCQINDQGLYPFISAKCPKLEVLDLQGCQITDKGCQMLAEAKDKWTNLIQINLRNNPKIQDEIACQELLKKAFPRAKILL